MGTSRFVRRMVTLGGLSVPTLALAASLSIGTAGAATPAATGPSVCPQSSDLGAAAPFNEFAFGDASRGHAGGDDAEGNVAYGGNATITDDFYVGNYTDSQPAAVVGGNVTGELIPQGGATGTYGGTISQPVPNMTHAQPPFSFSQVAQQLSQKSTLWGQDAQTAGAVVSTDDSSLFLTGSDPTFNTFDLSAGQFAAAQTIFVNVPIGSVVLVNVPDTDLSTTTLQDLQYWDGSNYETGDQYDSDQVDQVRNSTMFNFPNARTLNFSQAALAATFVAPNANFTFNDGETDGNVIASQIHGDFESEFDPAFTGCTATPPTATPEVSTVVALPVAAVAVGGAVVFWRRRHHRRQAAR